MKEKHNKIDRRNFLKTMGATGLGSVLAGCKGKEETPPVTVEPGAPERAQEPEYPQVSRRKLGKTGVEVPCLALGTIFNVLENQILLRKSLEWGVTYWDTAHGYAGGNSELGIGKFLAKNPDVRKKLFIVSKASGARTVADVEKRLQTSLERMNTKYIDLYYGVHGLDEPEQLTNELKNWAESAKKRNLIRFFGFSTHENMAECLTAAARLDWIDAVMPSYNFRLMQDDKMQAAVEACHKAGIGLIAMKIQAKEIKTKEDKELAEHFLQRGFTEGQAKVKIVLEDKRISSACVGRDNLTHLQLNIAAVLDKTKLTLADMDVLKEYAQVTCSGYCAGCGHICSLVLPDTPYVSKIMRYLMYYNSYGEQKEARQLFTQIPADVRNKLLSTDYSAAEARCPQHLQIAELMAEAVSKLA
ncbi:MAG: aldo/keto reductase [Planctomycetota bacterium]|jgi:predicted aldo/keto reductase-like oxidoreductase